MLRIIQNKSAGSAKSYYSHSDYLSEGQELTGVWGGKAAKQLGLEGEVEKQCFDRLCDNLHPLTGDKLTLRTNTDRTVGYDFNFHVPKGVSLAYMLGNDHRILDAFRASVDETMQELEQQAKTRVRKHGLEEDRTTSNLAWAQFIHKTARPVDGEPDPHLHAHCFVFNTTWDEKEGVWKAGQFRDLKRDAPYFEAAFHARLAGRLRELGYTIERKGKHWDIANVPVAIRQKFQRRTDQIEELARKKGITDPEQKDQLAAKSREKKQKAASMPELQWSWRKRLSLEERNALVWLEDNLQQSPVLGFDVEQESRSMAFATSHNFETHSVVPTTKLLTDALRHGVGRVSVTGIHQQLDLHKVICRDLEGRSMATTPEVLQEEKSLLRYTREGVNKEDALNPHWSIKRDWLNDDQRKAVEHVLTSRNSLMMIRGGAGTGKTSLMQEAVEGIEAGGKQVFTFAPSSRASRNLLKDEGFNATTVAELLTSEKLQDQIQDQVIWIDEAGLLGTITLKKVMDLAQAKHARVILSGDWKQHGSVERGAAMRLLDQRGGIKPAEVRVIQRQKGAYREAVAMLAEGQTEAGLQALLELGWVEEIEDSDARYTRIAEEFADGIARGETVLATAPTHAESELLTGRIRAELMRREIIDSVAVPFQQLTPLRLSVAEKADGERLTEGDVIVFHRSGKGFKKGQRLQVKDGLPAKLGSAAGQFDVYRQQTVELAKGDLVRITQNGKTLDGNHRLDNGMIYPIDGFTKEGDLRLENGWIIGKDFGFLTHGYVATSHSSQGRTVDRVLIAESSMSFPAASREQFYVSVSRAKSSATIFTDSVQALTDAVSRSDPRLSATELVDDLRMHRQRRARLQRTIKHNELQRDQFQKVRLAYERG